MGYLYNTLIICLYFLIKLSGIFHKKARLWIHGRSNWRYILSKKRKKDEIWIWFHCSSLGEYEDCSEIFIQFKNDNPSKRTILTFFSPSGYEVMKDSKLYDIVLYLPLDTKKNSMDFLDILKPEIVFFSRSELWFNFLLEIQRRNISAFLLSLKIDPNSNFIKWPVIKLYRKCFAAFKHIYCQDIITQKYLLSHFKYKNSSITGNTRFERIYKQSLYGQNIPYIENFVRNSFVIVAGSCLPVDQKNVLQASEYFDSMDIKWIIVPHEIDTLRIDKIIKLNPINRIRYSNIKALSESHKILFIDHVGILKHLYKYAHLAIVGGGFNRIGIHNIIEPSVYGVKITFGPNHKNHQEALDLLNIGGATIHKDSKELLDIISTQFAHPSDNILKEKIINYVKTQTGDCSVIIKSIREQLS